MKKKEYIIYLIALYIKLCIICKKWALVIILLIANYKQLPSWFTPKTSNTATLLSAASNKMASNFGSLRSILLFICVYMYVNIYIHYIQKFFSPWYVVDCNYFILNTNTETYIASIKAPTKTLTTIVNYFINTQIHYDSCLQDIS